MLCSIYKITNRINNKVYIGQTWKLIQHRFHGHKSTSHCRKLVAAFNKHGRSNFYIHLITVCSTQETADHLESVFIKKYDSIKNGYNLKDGGSHGKTHEETKRKLSERLKGRIPFWSIGTKATEETRAKLSHARKGKKKSKEHIAAIIASNNTLENKLKRSLNMKNKTWKLINGIRVYSNKTKL